MLPILVCFIFLISWLTQGLALDSTLVTLDNNIKNPSGSNSDPQAVCASNNYGYYFLDAYNGTVLPSTTPLPTGTSIALNFYNKGNPNSYTTAVPCDGKYKLIFNIQLRAETNTSSITITPLILNQNGSKVYPSSTGPTSFTIYPQCNNPAYATTPYCTVSEISGSALLSLNSQDALKAPTITASSNVTVIGGSFEIYSCPKGSTTC